MNYDVEVIKKRVKDKKQDFLTRVSVTATVGLILVILAFVSAVDDNLRLACGICGFVMLFYVKSLFDSYNARVLFSKEIKGINIKEDLYVTRKAYGPGLRYKQEGASGLAPIAPNTGANRKKQHPRLRSSVYLRLEDGNVAEIRDLKKEHIELYNDGDTLIKLEGTKYPTIIGRRVTSQPCPICGEINGEEYDCCIGCSLPIREERQSTEIV